MLDASVRLPEEVAGETSGVPGPVELDEATLSAVDVDDEASLMTRVGSLGPGLGPVTVADAALAEEVEAQVACGDGGSSSVL